MIPEHEKMADVDEQMIPEHEKMSDFIQQMTSDILQMSAVGKKMTPKEKNSGGIHIIYTSHKYNLWK